MAPELITQAELARRLGVSRQYVGKLVKEGKIQKVGKKIDFESASKALRRIADPARSSSSDDSVENTTFAEAKTMKEIYHAKLARLKFEEESSKLVEKSLVEDRARDIAVTIKESLLMLPTKLMETLAVESDPREINVILDREVRELLAAMAQEIKKK